MRDDQPSRTAAWVAACRGLAPLLPQEARLASDPFGARFGGRGATALRELAERLPRVVRLADPLLARLLGPIEHLILWLQLRTRVLDDALLAFVRDGGRQVVLLGAGFDCRAARFPRELSESVVYEIDHPATQARKRRVLDEAGATPANVRYLEWDFEREPLERLPDRLAALGHRHDQPTLTIWEGVTMYLTEDAIDTTVRAVRTYSAARSPFAFSYFERARVERPPPSGRLGMIVARLGEPWRFGWDPVELPAWLELRGFGIESDRTDGELAQALLPPRYAARVRAVGRHVAIAR